MKNLYSIIRSGLLATALVSTSALADLSDILSSGKVKIAVPEAFAPFGSVGATESTRATTSTSRSLSRRILVLSSSLSRLFQSSGYRSLRPTESILLFRQWALTPPVRSRSISLVHTRRSIPEFSHHRQ